MKNKARIEKVLVFNDSIFSIGDIIRVKTKNEIFIGRIIYFYNDMWSLGDVNSFCELDCSEKNKSILNKINLSDIEDVTKEEDQ